MIIISYFVDPKGTSFTD